MKDEFLKIIQSSFPLEKRPFEKIAKKLNSTEEEILDLYKSLKEEKIIRQTAAILETKKVGYKSTLVAFSVKDIEKAAEIINTHPGVSHNYERNHEIFNLWFTLAVPEDSKLGIEKTIEILAKVTNTEQYIILPTIKMFKIGVILDTTSSSVEKEEIKRKEYKDINLTQLHKDIMYYLQKDIMPVKEPFKEIVERLNIDYDTFFEEINNLLEAGYIRRFATILNHRKAGFTANAMVVWNVPDEVVNGVGEELSQYKSVSHCYIRPRYQNWHYNLFSMIHGKSEDEVNQVITEISKKFNIKDFKSLYSTREFKKSRIEYFSKSFNEWEENFSKNL